MKWTNLDDYKHWISEPFVKLKYERYEDGGEL